MGQKYSKINISNGEAVNILKSLYEIHGELIKLEGELDFNFWVKNIENDFILKISRPNSDIENIQLQSEILNFISENSDDIVAPKLIPDKNGNIISKISDSNGNERLVRLLTWIDGRLYSQVNPKNDRLLYSLGQQAGKITSVLKNFDHPFAYRKFDWDIANAGWTKKHISLFSNEQQDIVNYFHDLFSENELKYKTFRKSLIHNDVNDNNVIVSKNYLNPSVVSVIDYGDSVYTQTINDLAICIAYGVMEKPDVLLASLEILRGYNNSFKINEEELKLLYSLVAMRLIITVTKSAINKEKEPDNKYLQISEKPAWSVLIKWKELNEQLAHYSFRNTCGFISHPEEEVFKSWTVNRNSSLAELFPSINFDSVCPIDMSVSSTFIGNESVYNNNDNLSLKLKALQLENPKSLIAGGYLETRPIYITDAYKKEGNNGPEYRSTHLGVDFWVDPLTPIHTILDGVVFSIYNNSNDKDYGPTIILKHNISTKFSFYTLYGHLSESSLSVLSIGEKVSKGDLIGYIGHSGENGNWVPHLHFQIMLDMLGNKTDFPGVAFSNEINIWKSICPDPNILFKNSILNPKNVKSKSDILLERKSMLGGSLSVSYDQPLHIVRGQGQYLIDNNGRKYLDTVNNVAHVGHEHPEVVKAGQEQMAVLNTNTRYLHENINDFANELLKTFPEKLNVVHFVNSGSEANELALRMAKSFTNQKDVIAIEVGYHGNTSGCVDVSSYKFDGIGGKGSPEFTHVVPLPDSYRGLYTGDDSGILYSGHIVQQIKNIQEKGRNVSAFICESIISCGGQIELPNNYLQLAYSTIRNSGGVCISDEVQVGCGRVGKHFWGFELYDVIPDIVTIGKPIGNGHPIAAVVCTKEIAEAFNNGMEYFNTFGGNPVSSAIGKKVLETIDKEDLQKNALLVGNYLVEKLNLIKNDFQIIGDVRGQGLFLGIELVTKSKLPETKKASYLANRMRELGVLMSTDGKDNNVLKIKPPLIFSKENADELIFRLIQVLNEDFMRIENE